MTISIKFFASLREKTGQSEASLNARDAMTIAEVWRDIIESSDNTDNKAELLDVQPGRVLCAINQEYANWNSAVSDGDEVAFFPKVTGG